VKVTRHEKIAGVGHDAFVSARFFEFNYCVINCAQYLQTGGSIKPRRHVQQCPSNIVECYKLNDSFDNVECCFDNAACCFDIVAGVDETLGKNIARGYRRGDYSVWGECPSVHIRRLLTAGDGDGRSDKTQSTQRCDCNLDGCARLDGDVT